jgi:hypothetical protein
MPSGTSSHTILSRPTAILTATMTGSKSDGLLSTQCKWPCREGSGAQYAGESGVALQGPVRGSIDYSEKLEIVEASAVTRDFESVPGATEASDEARTERAGVSWMSDWPMPSGATCSSQPRQAPSAGRALPGTGLWPDASFTGTTCRHLCVSPERNVAAGPVVLTSLCAVAVFARW